MDPRSRRTLAPSWAERANRSPNGGDVPGDTAPVLSVSPPSSAGVASLHSGRSASMTSATLDGEPAALSSVTMRRRAPT